MLSDAALEASRVCSSAIHSSVGQGGEVTDGLRLSLGHAALLDDLRWNLIAARPYFASCEDNSSLGPMLIACDAVGAEATSRLCLRP